MSTSTVRGVYLIAVLPLLALLACVCSYMGMSAEYGHDYEPHQPGPEPWMEGWYTRISDARGFSIAIGFGHFPEGISQGAAAACFMLLQPPASPDRPEASGDPQRGQLETDAVYPPSFDFDTSHCSHNNTPCFKAASQSCTMQVDNATSFTLNGTLNHHSFSITTLANSRIQPWARNKDGPEGWAASLGSLLQLHWYVFSMGTAVSYHITDLRTNTTLQGSGMAHLEKNWGSGFPTKWLWAQGHYGRGGTCGQAGGEQPAAAGAAVAQPLRQLHAQKLHRGSRTGPASSSSSSSHPSLSSHTELHQHDITSQHGEPSDPQQRQATSSSSSSGAAATFALAGGQVPIRFLPASLSPQLFLFSYHSPSLNISLDTWSPGLPTAVQQDGCAASILLTLSAVAHIVDIRIQADPGSFSPITCPTRQGFQDDSVESFSARAEVSVYARSWPLGRGKLVGHSVWDAAAVEFGGSFRCGQGSGGAAGAGK